MSLEEANKEIEKLKKQLNEKDNNEIKPNPKIELLKEKLERLEKKLKEKEKEIQNIKNDPESLEDLEANIEEKEAIEKQIKIVGASL
ncbi:hypothetical protein [Spiroplasma endosymbiont of Villa modesta]|uniref:hypothetical protein n=1 Tax=Spiroplasma endosymbiont of Villa modesta TaxID=3066293 RepID=UPI00313F29BA